MLFRSATVTNGSPTVTGSGTLWLANVTAGDSFTVAGDGVMYDVASVDSDTQVTLSVNYAGVTAASAVYTIARDFTSPDDFPELTTGDIETPTIITRALRKIQSKFTGIVSDIGGKANIAGQTFTGDIAAPKITASTGILFGTDTAAANTLDDYEQGAWSAEALVELNITSLSITASEYTKIGNMVLAELKGSFSVTSASSVRTGFSFALPVSNSISASVIGGGGRIQAPSILEVNPTVSSSAGNSGAILFISYESGDHDFEVSFMYRGA